MKVIDHLIQTIRKLTDFNPAAQAAPCCILWPDKDRQWEAVIPRLQLALPELFVLGSYDTAKRQGPAIWLRCIVAGTVAGTNDSQRKPILYLPDVSRQDLRAVEQCAELLKPLAELQYRSALWSQQNGRDWTVFAYFKTNVGGLGLDVAQDRDATQALQSALQRLLDEAIATLSGKHLDKEFFTMLLAGDDPIRDVLRWLENPAAFKTARRPEEWQAFVAVCKSKLSFHPDHDGTLTAAERIAGHTGAWETVWNRFCEAPAKYTVLPELIRQTVMPLGVDTSGWPQWNESEEIRLRADLKKCAALSPDQARMLVLQLEGEHGERRNTVWAELGEAPLSSSLAWLAVVARSTAQSVAGNVTDLAAAYASSLWQADDAVLQALAAVKKQDDVEAVTAAVRTVYGSWLEDGARQLQQAIRQSAYPGGDVTNLAVEAYQPAECILFIDGLRFDVAKRLSERLQSRGMTVSERLRWSGLPSVTATCKPITMPIRQQLYGEGGAIDFEPAVTSSGKAATHDRLEKLLQDAGWSVLTHSIELSTNGWDESVSIDSEGHQRGWKLVYHLESLLSEIVEHVRSLLDAGWKSIRIVTDHGWLLLPGGLPKVDLPAALAENKWGRCASIKTGAICNEPLHPWYWNPDVQVALPAGISCYRNNKEYSHGGLSLQECLLLELLVSTGSDNIKTAAAVILHPVWKGLRCAVAVEGGGAGLKVDLRLQPGNPDSSIVLTPKQLDAAGKASVVVENDSLEGKQAVVVLVDSGGTIIGQTVTKVGGG